LVSPRPERPLEASGAPATLVEETETLAAEGIASFTHVPSLATILYLISYIYIYIFTNWRHRWRLHINPHAVTKYDHPIMLLAIHDRPRLIGVFLQPARLPWCLKNLDTFPSTSSCWSGSRRGAASFSTF
jgi:hypothetical protein